MLMKGTIIIGTVGLVIYEELFLLQEEEWCMGGWMDGLMAGNMSNSRIYHWIW